MEVFLNPRPEHLNQYYEFEVAPSNQWLDLKVDPKRSPFSFWLPGGARLVYIEPPDPEAFLNQLNRAWDRWKLTHPEGKQ